MQGATTGHEYRGRSMKPAGSPHLPSSWLAWLPLAAAVAAGTWLRCQQWFDQVLIDDEWHLVHRLVLSTPREMFLDFGYADYGIPLGLLYAALGNLTSFSESLLRLPMLVAGVATLVVLPMLVLRRAGLAAATVLAWLLAISPLLIVYSRLARPYAIVLLLVWIAVFALARVVVRHERAFATGCVAAVTSVLAIWMHLAMACYVAAAFVMAAAALAGVPHAGRRAAARRLGIVALATGLACAVLVLPPLLAHPEAMTRKSGLDSPNVDTVLSAWFAWVGTTSPWVAGIVALLAAIGLPRLLRSVPQAAAVALGTVLAFLLVVATRPASSHYGIVLARYLLPTLPLVLLAAAVGAMALLQPAARRAPRATFAAAGVAGAAACVVLLATSPAREWWERPNANALHMQYYFDFRPGRNPYLPHLDRVPDSAFWRLLARRPPGSVRVAVAPFYFESFNWNAPEWERESGQMLIPAYLSGFCVDWRWGEVPRGPRFAFRNAVRLGSTREIAARGIDLVVWQKPYVRGTDLVGEETLHCEAVLRERFGAPVYEDAALLAFAVRPAPAGRWP